MIDIPIPHVISEIINFKSGSVQLDWSDLTKTCDDDIVGKECLILVVSYAPKLGFHPGLLTIVSAGMCNCG